MEPPVAPTADRVPIAAEFDGDLVQPYVPATESPTELTVGGIVLGIVLGLIFAASSVYLALKVSLTVSASIPIAVLSITIFRYIQRAFGGQPSILRNNIVQTTGSAGESIAAGVAFTLPGLILMGYELAWTKVMAISVVGGLLGVLLMIPLRRSLIVKEHRNLKYPEGTACAEVLIVGEKRGVQAQTVFMGFGLGALYKFMLSGMRLWAEVARKVFERVRPDGFRELFGEIRAEISPELTGVGYIIGPRIAGYLFAGGVISYFVIIPTIKLFGAGASNILPFQTQPISEMDASAVRGNFIFYIGAGAVTAAGLISLIRSMPTIWSALRAGLGDFRGGASGASVPRTQQDMPMSVVFGGVVLCILMMVFLPQIGINFFGAILAVLFAFLFVTVSSRIAGQIGASANPISGMTVATVLLTALIFLAVGWVGIEHRVLALSIGGVVCVAAAVAAATSQDLKTGYLVGATPKRQQIGLLFGVVSSAILIGGTIQFLNEANTTRVAVSYPNAHVQTFESKTRVGPDGQTYRIGHVYDQAVGAPPGRYLVNQAGQISYLLDPGIGGRNPKDISGREVAKLDSPKAQIMALVVDGILKRELSWGLILIGVFFTVALEILGLPSLPIAVGAYLPISTSATMFMGGIVRWLVERKMTEEERSSAHADSGPGVLFSSGLIAGGAITGVIVTALAAQQLDRGFNFGERIGAFGTNNLVAIIIYVLAIGVPLYMIGNRKLDRGH
jgi:putative OPT family oligopeptide transporter